MMKPMHASGDAAPALLNDVRQLIEQARAHVASAANSAQTLLYWQVGERIRREVLGEARAEGDARRFTLLQGEYKNAPEVTRKRLWLETVEQVLAENRKVIGGDGRQLIYVPMPADA